jgi:hypothetical protein
MALESMAALPVKAEAANFVTAIARLPMIAAMIAVFDSEATASSSPAHP